MLTRFQPRLVVLKCVLATEGNSWTLVDADTVSGSFASVSAPLEPGLVLTFSTAAGGNNGQVLSATASNQLVLAVNVVTGAMSIDNLSSITTEVIDGYSITGTASQLDQNNWTSFEDDSQAGWEEANAESFHLGELNLGGSRNIGTGSIDLGTPYLQPTEFGVEPDLQFDYHLTGAAGGETRLGAVIYSVPNSLLLRVDPSDGQTELVNTSGSDVAIDGYSITSASAALDDNAWVSFQDDGQVGWEEANAASNHVGELSLTGSRQLTKLEGNTPISLGPLFDFDKAGAEQDLEFTFSLIGGDANPGDLDGDGDVDGNDFRTAQLTDPSSIPTVLANYGSTGGGGGPDGIFTGVVQYVDIANGAAAAAIPEPSTCMVGLIGILAILFRRDLNLSLANRL